MPRGGPQAPWWDRWYETGRAEYLDQPGAGARVEQVLRGLERFQRLTGAYRVSSRLASAEVAGVPAPAVLELGAGSGRMTRHLLAALPTARLTVSDVNRRTVDAFRTGPLGQHPRTETSVLDATAIDADDDTWDLAVFAFSLHHLDPASVQAALREGTRVARRLLIIDGWRHPAFLAVAPPLMLLTGGLPHLHDGVISLRKVYSASALRALAATSGVHVSLRCRFALPGYLVVSARRAPCGTGRGPRSPDSAEENASRFRSLPAGGT